MADTAVRALLTEAQALLDRKECGAVSSRRESTDSNVFASPEVPAHQPKQAPGSPAPSNSSWVDGAPSSAGSWADIACDAEDNAADNEEWVEVRKLDSSLAAVANDGMDVESEDDHADFELSAEQEAELAIVRTDGQEEPPLEGEAAKPTIESLASTVLQGLGESPREEPRYRFIVRTIGIDLTRAIFRRTMETERSGGMLTRDGKYRRSPGGVFFELLKSEASEDMIRSINKFRKDRQKRGQQSRGNRSQARSLPNKSKERHSYRKRRSPPGSANKRAAKKPGQPRLNR